MVKPPALCVGGFFLATEATEDTEGFALVHSPPTPFIEFKQQKKQKSGGKALCPLWLFMPFRRDVRREDTNDESGAGIDAVMHLTVHGADD